MRDSSGTSACLLSAPSGLPRPHAPLPKPHSVPAGQPEAAPCCPKAADQRDLARIVGSPLSSALPRVRDRAACTLHLAPVIVPWSSQQRQWRVHSSVLVSVDPACASRRALPMQTTRGVLRDAGSAVRCSCIAIQRPSVRWRRVAAPRCSSQDACAQRGARPSICKRSRQAPGRRDMRVHAGELLHGCCPLLQGLAHPDVVLSQGPINHSTSTRVSTTGT